MVSVLQYKEVLITIPKLKCTCTLCNQHVCIIKLTYWNGQ